MRLSRLAPLILGLAALAACVGGRVPATTYYRLQPPECRPSVTYPHEVALLRLRAGPVYQDDALLFRPSAYEIDSYGTSRWEAMPADMLTEHLYRFLRDCRLFREVTMRGLSGEPDLLLQGRITSFEEVDTDEGAFAELAMEMELVCAASPKRVWGGELSASTPMSERSPRELARAMSASLAAVLGEMAERLGPALETLRAEGCAGKPGAGGQALQP